MSGQVLCSNTDVTVKNYKYYWHIKNYGMRYRNTSEDSIESPPIIFNDENKTVWKLKLSHVNSERDCIELYLKKGTLSANITADLSILNSNKKNRLYSTKQKLNENIKSESRDPIDILSFFVKAISNNLTDGTLIVYLKVTYHYFTQDSECTVYKPTTNNSQNLYGYERLFKDEKFTDATIIVGDHEINVHKCVLSDKSTYFSNEFENDMKEKRESKVVIKDVSFEVTMEVLRFIYTGKVDNMENLKEDILIASDKYLIDELKTLCEVAMVHDFKIENILDMLKLSEIYNAITLREKALEFYKIHKLEITKSENFKTALQNNLIPASILTDLLKT